MEWLGIQSGEQDGQEQLRRWLKHRTGMQGRSVNKEMKHRDKVLRKKSDMHDRRDQQIMTEQHVCH